METKMGQGGKLEKDPDHDHNDPTSQDNEVAATPTNAKGDADKHPISEAEAAKHRKAPKEFAADDESDDEAEELSDEEVQELTIRVTQLERAVLAFASGKLAEFSASLPVVELASTDDEEDDDKNDNGGDE